MKFVLTVIATLFVMVTAWKVSQDNAPQTEVQRSEFLPELLASANDVDALTIRNSDNETRLERQGENWVISNKDGYPAKIADIRKTLLQLARLISVEAKTSRPEQHGRIGLLTPASGDGAGTLVRASAEDNELVSLIIGNSRNAGSQQQHYIRRTAEDQSWLVAGELVAESNPIMWLDAQISDIDTERVRSIEINPGAEDSFSIRKLARDEQYFTIDEIPEGFEPKSRASVSALGAVLLDLRLNDVASASQVEGQNPEREMTLKTFDGLIAHLSQYSLNDQPYTRFRFSFDPDGVVAGDEDKDDGADADADEAPSETVEEEIARLNKVTDGWIYQLPDYKQRLVSKTKADLIKAVESEDSE